MKVRKKKSFNKKALFRMVALAIFSGVMIVSLFYTVEMYHIKQRAETVLNEFISVTKAESNKILPEVSYICTDELENDLPDDAEQELLRHYIENKQNIPLNTVKHFSCKGFEAYYFAKAVGIVGQKSGEVYLIYTDVSFTVNTVRSAVYILIAAMLVIACLIYYVGHRTVKALDEKDEGMKNFFAGASHELKTPLMAIRGYADGIKAGIVEPDKACAVITKETDRMTDLINNILEFSKLDSGAAQPHIAENDIREILYDAIGVIAPSAEAKGIEIIPDLPEPILFCCDEDMLFSVFSNILTNSLRYAGSHILITAKIQKADPHLLVTISNDGILISEEDRTHLFERFYKGKGGQSGIGMALSLEYIKLHGGNIEVFLKDDKTVFEVKM